MKNVGLVTFRRDRYGNVVDPNFPYCTCDVDEAKKIVKVRKANKVVRKERGMCEELKPSLLESSISRQTGILSPRTALQWILDVVIALRERNPDVFDCMKTTIDLIERYARDGLKFPKRNCDIYKTSGEADRAITEYCSKMAETGECVKSCPYRESEGGCAFGWILAATTKGEGDGSQ